MSEPAPEPQRPFSDRKGWIWMDGGLVPWAEARVHALTHALHYASSVFEGERSYAGRVFRLREHSQRLIDSAAALDMNLPCSAEELDAATREVVAANAVERGGEIENGDCYVRPLAWRGSEGMGVTNKDAKVHLMIAVWPWTYLDGAIRKTGLRLGPARYRRPSPECFPATVKCSGLYTICTLNKNAAKAAGYDDALVLGPRGQVAESTSANLFAVLDGALTTPVPDCFLNGITRQCIMRLAQARNIPVIARDIMPEELRNATEVFLTGTAVEIAPVREVALEGESGPIQMRYGVPGPITRHLLADFDAVVRSEAAVSA